MRRLLPSAAICIANIVLIFGMARMGFIVKELQLRPTNDNGLMRLIAALWGGKNLAIESCLV